MGKCVVCGKETPRVLFKDAIVKTHICSEKCLRKYFEPIGGVKIVQKKTKRKRRVARLTEKEGICGGYGAFMVI